MLDLSDRHVVVLPDVYVDALAQAGPWEPLAEAMDAVAARGGGNVPIGRVDLRIGGNAANLALALAALGAQTHLVAETDPLGRFLLDRAASGLPLDTSHVREGRTKSLGAAVTLGLECGSANVMLSHAGPVADFGPERLSDEDWALIEEADAVAIVNWAQNQQGTALQRAVARRASGFVYVDTGDPRHRGEAARQLSVPEAWKGVSAWGLNENEVRAFAGDEGTAVDAACRISERLGIRVDLHTRDVAVSVDGAQVVAVDADPTPGRRATGAGDAWNAGNLAGHLLEWEPRRRLRLAHQVATRYVCSTAGQHPRAHELTIPQ